MSSAERAAAAVLLAASLVVLPPGRGYPSGKPVKSGPGETVLQDPVDRSLRLSVRISVARKEGKRASYFRSIARQRMTRHHPNRGGRVAGRGLIGDPHPSSVR